MWYQTGWSKGIVFYSSPQWALFVQRQLQHRVHHLYKNSYFCLFLLTPQSTRTFVCQKIKLYGNISKAKIFVTDSAPRFITVFLPFSSQTTHFPRLPQNVNPPPPVATPGKKKKKTAQAETSCITCKFDISNWPLIRRDWKIFSAKTVQEKTRRKRMVK